MDKINGFYLPIKIINLLNEGKLTEISLKNLSMIYPFLNYPMVFFDLNSIKVLSNANDLLDLPHLGIKSSKINKEEINFPFLDFDKSLLIGGNKIPGDDLAIALDYRENQNVPKVVATDFSSGKDHCEWRVIGDTFDEFWKRITGKE